MSVAADVPDILSPEFEENPYATYRAMHERVPMLWHERMEKFVISRYEDVARACKDPAFTTDNYAWQLAPAHGGRILPQMNGREHSIRRALVAPAFRGNDLKHKFLPVIERTSRNLIDAFRHTGRAELVGDVTHQLPIKIIVDILGLDPSNYQRFQRWYLSLTDFLGNLSQDPAVTAQGLATAEEFAAYMIPVVRERRENPGDDLLSTLCAAEVEGTQMSDQDIKSFVSLLLGAGGETTDKALAGLFKNLLEHPDQLEAVRADRTLVEKALVETLRYSPPVHMLMRVAAEDIELSAGVVPAGSTVILLLAAANRDPARFADPDRFDIFRDDLPTETAFSAAAQHLAFSLGRHFCVGAMLAKAELETAANQLLDAMPGVHLEPGFTPVEKGVFTRGPVALPVRFQVG
ncbi:cytochrome P450 [Amycolatopsis pigmentata]|uniref:Cytochrome P450 n=1 Tax=Amycolatopsis pigmentata TaxID=450801 RepID=A0ABW5FU03_9PSEU